MEDSWIIEKDVHQSGRGSHGGSPSIERWRFKTIGIRSFKPHNVPGVELRLHFWTRFVYKDPEVEQGA